MFKSIVKNYHNNTYSITVIDDDFKEILLIDRNKIIVDASFIIELYQSKNLNVPANLVLYFRYIASQYSSLSVQNQIEWNSKYNNLYKPYAAEIEKYFILL